MMLLLYLTLSIFYLIPFIIDKKSDFFSPGKLLSFYGFITTIPYLIMLYFDPTKLHYYQIASTINDTNFDDVVTKFSFIMMTGLIALYAGIYSKPFPPLIKIFNRFRVSVPNHSIRYATLLVFITGLIAWLYRVQYAGGLIFLWENVQNRVNLLAGSGYIALIMESSLSLSVLLYIFSFKFKDSRRKRITLILLFLATAFMFSVFGGRKSTLYLLLFSLITWQYAVKPFRRPVFLFLMCSLVVPIYFVAFLLIRDSTSGAELALNPIALIKNSLEQLELFISNISYVDTYLFITKFFSEHDFWWGKTFGDLQYAIIPSSIMPDKPPIDEGRYIRTLASNYLVNPPMPTYSLYESGWPPESFGNGYLNFGVTGVVLFMYIKGAVVSSAYRAMLISKGNPILIYLYCFMLLNFHLTNLRLVQTLSVFVGASLVILIIFFSNKLKSITTGH